MNNTARTTIGINKMEVGKRFRRFWVISILCTAVCTYIFYNELIAYYNGAWSRKYEFDTDPVTTRKTQENEKIKTPLFDFQHQLKMAETTLSNSRGQQPFLGPTPQTTTPKQCNSNGSETHSQQRKKILYFNKFFEIKHFDFGVGVEPFIGCAVNNCQIWDKEDGVPPFPVEEFDAIIFHGLDPNQIAKNKPSKRSPRQRYIFYLLESPQTHLDLDFKPLAYFFNWTITYRKDSDIQAINGFISNDSNPSKIPIKWLEANYENVSKYIKHYKTKPVAWMVSNCITPSKREDYVKKLAQSIQVDIYGLCGNLICARSKTDDICYRMLENDYFFYLAFENSLCKDYVTEKLFLYMAYDIVPVVYGHADYKDHAPPMSYIDYSNFSGPHELAEYLHFLIDNPEEYRKYFWWKSYYKSDNTYGKNVMCTLCEMLNDDAQPPRVYEDIHDWWTNPKLCRKPEKF